MKTLSVILLTIALLFESTLTTVPLILLVLLVIISLSKHNFVFVLAFIFGMLFDFVTLKTIGITSIYFEVFLFLVLLYQSKFEIATNMFIVVASFLGSISFLILQGYIDNIILQSLTSVVLGLIMFKSLQKLKVVRIYNS